jgi:K+ transporter
MMNFYIHNRKVEAGWKRHIVVHIVGLILCMTILTITVYMKFQEGGWVTLVITSVVIGICFLIKGHYRKVRSSIRKLEQILSDLPSGTQTNKEPLDPSERTAVLLVSGYNGFGLHAWLSVMREFPKLYKNFIFVSVGEVDSGSFKGAAEVAALEASVRENLEKYVSLARSHGFAADYRMAIGTDVVIKASELCKTVVAQFPRATVFTGQLIFRNEYIFQKVLNIDTAFAIQRRLQWDGITTVILPVRVDL